VVGGVRRTISTSELRISQKRIEVEEENRKSVQSKREVAADSLQSIQLKVLDLDTNLEGASELGPLQYLSGLTGYGMDRIINWLILIIIFVFDPLAVALVVAFNNALQVDRGIVDKQKVIRRRELYDEVPEEEDIDEIDVKDEEEVLPPEARGFEPPKKELELTKADIRLYTHPNFNWEDRRTWQNDPKAVHYWIKNIKDKRYPDDFETKTY
tara:strand:- start:2230 stop:2865 length:636 start_codon:yes stop_codon:yes gene_type:complete